ncbi:hypothetical protein GXW78_24010 [Roseomonas terrae]|uniref:Uncharacterized protein n=1 Tax=Neoroseomonas terrae TaxID=424799 RepID=A0ABS5ENX2_9PROT|nr:hypothetical protein [Neoroseomonas terrae]MBR0652743.1 hypothetical protein [Neoroseomonas terrae]
MTYKLPSLEAEFERYREAREALVESGDAAAIPDFLFRWCNSTERPVELLALYYNMANADDALFWRLIADEWSGFDRIPLDDYIIWFEELRAAWSPGCMEPTDRAAYDALPDEVTVYRGQSATVPLGLAWTLRRDVAVGFAAGHRGISVPSPAIVTTRVKKTDIAFVCTDRNEDAVVLFEPPGAEAVTMEIIGPASSAGTKH